MREHLANSMLHYHWPAPILQQVCERRTIVKEEQLAIHWLHGEEDPVLRSKVTVEAKAEDEQPPKKQKLDHEPPPPLPLSP